MRTFKTIFIRVISAVLIFLIIGFLSGKSNKVYAQSVSCTLLTSDYQIIKESNDCSSISVPSTPVRRIQIRINEDFQLLSGETYEFYLNWFAESVNPIGFNGGWVNGTNSSTSVVASQPVGAIYRNYNYHTLNTSRVNSSTNYIQYDFDIQGVQMNYFGVYNVSATQQGSSTNVAINNQTNQIINNNNNNTQSIINNQNANADKINNTLTDDNIDEANNSANNFFNDFNSDDRGLSDLIIAPIQLLQNISNSTCTSLTFPLPFVNQNVVLPCMSTIYAKFPTFLTLWQLITTGLISYTIGLNFFKKIKDLSNPQNDKVEVLSL